MRQKNSELQYKMVEITEAKQNKEEKKTMKSNKDSLKDVWDNNKCSNI